MCHEIINVQSDNYLAIIQTKPHFEQQTIVIDKFNERILQELSNHGRVSNAELADKIGLSPSATLRRVQELERTGMIKGYRAVLDSTKLGVGFIAYITVGLNNHTKSSQKAFEEAITRSNRMPQHNRRF